MNVPIEIKDIIKGMVGVKKLYRIEKWTYGSRYPIREDGFEEYFAWSNEVPNGTENEPMEHTVYYIDNSWHIKEENHYIPIEDEIHDNFLNFTKDQLNDTFL